MIQATLQAALLILPRSSGDDDFTVYGLTLNQSLLSLPTPIISTTEASCNTAGSAQITNYNASNTYEFSPSGPSVGTGGIIGMTPGTSYAVRAVPPGAGTACAAACTSNWSNQFTIEAVKDCSIGCGNTLYFSAGSLTQLYAIAPSGGSLGLSPVGSPAGFGYNATAIDPVTGIMYAMRGNTNMYQINGDGTAVDLGSVSGLSTTPPQYIAGEIDPLGNYYVAQSGTVGTVYKINTSTKVATARSLSRNITISDMAYNVNNNLLYAVESNGQLISINPVSGVITNVGTSYGPEVFGAMWGSDTGSIYAYRTTATCISMTRLTVKGY